MSQKKMQKIIIKLPRTIENMVKALPLLDALKVYFPDSELSVLVTDDLKAFLRGKDIDHIILFKKKPRFAPVLTNGEDVISFIQKNAYDIGITLPDSFSSAYIFFQGMVKRRIGFYRRFSSFLLTDIVRESTYAALLKPLGITIDQWEPKCFAKVEKHNHLHIGIKSNFDDPIATKRWFKDLIAFILEEIPSVQISILGEEKNFQDIEEVIGNNAASVFNNSKIDDCGEAIDLINNCDVFVSDDHAYAAIAESVETPVVDISGLIESRVLLAEDFFCKIKDAILLPLKNSAPSTSFSDLIPINGGYAGSKLRSPINKKVGVVILAGGMGRRLGLDKPKGFLTLGKKNLFDILLQKAELAAKVGILTSPVTFSETEKYCQGKDIDLFRKKVYPTESGDGVSPEGNGAVFDALVHSKYWKEWKELDLISVVAIDNPLADPLDIDLISTNKDLAVIGVERSKKDERLGVLCRTIDALTVREYFTLGNDGMEGLGYSGIFAATPSFFENVASKKLPFYRIEKQNQVFYERLVIDGFMYAKDFEVIEKDRKDCFFPIKEKRDLFTYCNEMNIGGKE